ERVVGSPLLLVAQHFVRFADFLEALLGVRLLADVRMVLARKAAIRPFDLVLRGFPGDAHNLVVVLVLHIALLARPQRRCAASLRETLGVSVPGIKSDAGAFSQTLRYNRPP